MAGWLMFVIKRLGRPRYVRIDEGDKCRVGSFYSLLWSELRVEGGERGQNVWLNVMTEHETK